MTPVLRPYQTEAVTSVAHRFHAGARRVLLVAATGSGKTVMAASAITRMVAAGKRVLFLAHRKELVCQAHAKLETFGVPAGIIMAGFRPESALTVQVASVQTLARREIPAADYVIVDEAHHATAAGYRRVFDALPAARVVGLTATPFRLDGRGLADIFDSYVLSPSPSALRDMGFLCGVTGWVFRALDTTDVALSGGDYNQAQLAATSNTILGDVVGEWLKHFRDNPVRTILFACGVAHSKQFVAAFQAAGVRAEHVDGSTPAAERDATLARVRSGATTVLSNCMIATEGFDLPELTCVILARPTKSLAVYLQQVGRVLRPAPGKLRAVIHDHANCLVTHGTPYDPSREYVPTRTKQRATALPSLTRCEQCGCYSDEHPCPECGHAAPRAVPTGPTVDLNVTAVALADLEREQTQPTDVRGLVSFRTRGAQYIGDLTRHEVAEGLYGPAQRYHFAGLRTPFYVDAPTALHALLRGIPLNTRVRMVYTGNEDTPRGFKKKLFKIYVPTATTTATTTVTE